LTSTINPQLSTILNSGHLWSSLVIFGHLWSFFSWYAGSCDRAGFTPSESFGPSLSVMASPVAPLIKVFPIEPSAQPRNRTFDAIMKTLFTAEAISKDGRSGSVHSPEHELRKHFCRHVGGESKRTL
jgi:hypothetical protein